MDRINKQRFILAETQSGFSQEIESGSLLDKDIAFIIESGDKDIYTHGVFLLDEIKNDIKKLFGNSQDHEDRITAAESNIAGLQKTTEQLTSDVTNLEINYNSLNSRVTVVENKITDINNQISNINIAIKNIQTDITEIRGDISDIDVQIKNINTTITNVQNTLEQKIEAITTTAVTIKVVTQLPDWKDADSHTIYLVKSDVVGENNVYTEYIMQNGQWEIIGKQEADLHLEQYVTNAQLSNTLNNYYTKSEVYTKTEIDNKLKDYTKLDTYTKAELDAKLNEKANNYHQHNTTDIVDFPRFKTINGHSIIGDGDLNMFDVGTATEDQNGLMSAEDKRKLDRAVLYTKDGSIAIHFGNNNGITVDNAHYYNIDTDTYRINLSHPGAKFLISAFGSDQSFQVEENEILMRTSPNTQVAVQEKLNRVNFVGGDFRFVFKPTEDGEYVEGYDNILLLSNVRMAVNDYNSKKERILLVDGHTCVSNKTTVWIGEVEKLAADGDGMESSGVQIQEATPERAGVMTAADKISLNKFNNGYHFMQAVGIAPMYDSDHVKIARFTYFDDDHEDTELVELQGATDEYAGLMTAFDKRTLDSTAQTVTGISQQITNINNTVNTINSTVNNIVNGSTTIDELSTKNLNVEKTLHVKELVLGEDSTFYVSTNSTVRLGTVEQNTTKVVYMLRQPNYNGTLQGFNKPYKIGPTSDTEEIYMCHQNSNGAEYARNMDITVNTDVMCVGHGIGGKTYWYLFEMKLADAGYAGSFGQ